MPPRRWTPRPGTSCGAARHRGDDARETWKPSAAGGSCRECCATCPRDLRTTVLGTEMPCCSRPWGCRRFFTRTGSCERARRAQVGVPVVASTAADRSMEEVGRGGRRWAAVVPALLAQGRRDHREPRAAGRRAGYRALVVTLDSVLLGWRPADLSRAYLPFLEGTGIAQFTSDPVFRAGLAKRPRRTRRPGGRVGPGDQQDRDVGRPEPQLRSRTGADDEHRDRPPAGRVTAAPTASSTPPRRSATPRTAR